MSKTSVVRARIEPKFGKILDSFSNNEKTN